MTVVVAVVPTYCPEEAPLNQLVSALLLADLPVTVSDDASPCTSDPALRHAADAGAVVVRHRQNAGIARGLNDGLDHAGRVGAQWLLTVDQDSRVDADVIQTLLAGARAASSLLGGRVGAVAAGVIDDASGPIGYPLTEVAGVPTTPEVIQTGTLWNVGALLEIGGFDESLGIDGVDAAACVRLRANGQHVVVVPDAAVEHRLGTAESVSLRGRRVLATGHSPARRTTIVRNRLRLFPEEFRESPAHALRTLRRVAVGTALAVTIEQDRWAKAKASARGLLPSRDR